MTFSPRKKDVYKRQHDDGCRLAGKVPPKGTGGAEVNEEKQHHLRHDADELQIQPQDRLDNGVAGGDVYKRQIPPSAENPLGCGYEDAAGVADTAAQVRALQRMGIRVSAVFMGEDLSLIHIFWYISLTGSQRYCSACSRLSLPTGISAGGWMGMHSSGT